MNESQFVVDSFAFLNESIPAKADIGLSLLSSKLNITCFDINERLLVFGSDCGAIYGFRRGEKAEKKAHFRMAPVSTSITNVKLVECDLLAFITGYQLIVYRLSTLQILYAWNNQLNVNGDSQQQHCTTVNLTTFVAVFDENLFLFSGDESGAVHLHRVSESKQELIFKEVESEGSEHVHQVVQIECTDVKQALVSTCLRSVIVRRCNDASQQILQIGKNSRKTCGKYGAVFCGDYLFAARPSLHLIKATKIDGNVIETFILKKAKDPPPLIDLCDVRSNCTQTTQLGSLIAFSTPSKGLEFIISWNCRSLLIIGAEGQVLIKESNLSHLIDVKTSSLSHFIDIFLLFKNRTFLRLRHDLNRDDAESSSAAQVEKQCDLFPDEQQQKLSDAPDEPKPDLAASFTTPQVFGQELKKIFLKFHNKLANDVPGDVSSAETTSNSDTSESEPKKLNEEECDADVLNEPLVVHKKYRRVKHKSKVDIDLDFKNDHVVHTEKLSASVQEDEVICESIDESKSTEDSDDVELRLSNILKAFRMNTSSADEQCLPSVDEDTVQNTEPTMEASNGHEIEVPSAIEPKELEMIEIKWNLVLEGSRNVNKIKMLSLCASSYDDQIGVGYVWLSCLINKQVDLYYLPSFKSIKCPTNKCKISSIGVNTKQMLLLYEDGSVYCRSGDSIKPLADKWHRVNADRPQCKLCSISLNNSNCVVWCCDVKGDAWMLKLSSSNQSRLVPVRDDNEYTIHFKVIVVAPQDSSLVWAISTESGVYMRNGIFNEHGKDDELIAGISWIKVDVPVISKSIAVTSHSVWILNEAGTRIFKRVGMEPPSDLLGHSWQEVKCPTLVNDCVKQLSASLNDDIWLLTRCGSVWQHCQHPLSSLQEVESDWILVR